MLTMSWIWTAVTSYTVVSKKDFTPIEASRVTGSLIAAGTGGSEETPEREIWNNTYLTNSLHIQQGKQAAQCRTRQKRQTRYDLARSCVAGFVCIPPWSYGWLFRFRKCIIRQIALFIQCIVERSLNKMVGVHCDETGICQVVNLVAAHCGSVLFSFPWFDCLFVRAVTCGRWVWSSTWCCAGTRLSTPSTTAAPSPRTCARRSWLGALSSQRTSGARSLRWPRTLWESELPPAHLAPVLKDVLIMTPTIVGGIGISACCNLQAQ